MLRALLVATVFTGFICTAAQVQAASFPPIRLGSGQDAPLKAEKIYWTRDPYGRRIWVPDRPYYPPPRYFHHRRWWDGHRWRY